MARTAKRSSSALSVSWGCNRIEEGPSAKPSPNDLVALLNGDGGTPLAGAFFKASGLVIFWGGKGIQEVPSAIGAAAVVKLRFREIPADFLVAGCPPELVGRSRLADDDNGNPFFEAGVRERGRLVRARAPASIGWRAGGESSSLHVRLKS